MVRKSEVHVGDRVQIVDIESYNLKSELLGERGEVVGFSGIDQTIAVQLDNKVGYGHGCDGMAAPGYSVWVNGASIDFDEAYYPDAEADFGILGF